MRGAEQAWQQSMSLFWRFSSGTKKWMREVSCSIQALNPIVTRSLTTPFLDAHLTTSPICVLKKYNPTARPSHKPKVSHHALSSASTRFKQCCHGCVILCDACKAMWDPLFTHLSESTQERGTGEGFPQQ